MTLEATSISADVLLEPVHMFPPIASFGRRLTAWATDSLLLGIIGQILGWSLSFIWFQIGPYGRIVGFLFILAYFGLMNSVLGNGQTVGKRLLKIAVRDQENRPIGVRSSTLRISILAIPAMLNQWSLPIFQNPILVWLLTVIIFGLGAAILYTMVFNRQTRQGLHDMVCGTYVVHLAGKPTEVFPQTEKIHWIVSGAFVFLAVILATFASFFGSTIVSRTALAPIYKLYQTLQTDSRFFSVGVNDNTIHLNSDKTIHSLQIQVWYKGGPSDASHPKIMNDIAKVVLDNTDNVGQYDLLQISVFSAYDLGIATGHITFNDGQPVKVWRERVN